MSIPFFIKIELFDNHYHGITRNYSNLVRIIIMQNSAHFGKNGVSNLVREGKNVLCFLPLI